MTTPDALARMRAAPACEKCRRAMGGAAWVTAIVHVGICDTCAAIVRDAALPTEPTAAAVLAAMSAELATDAADRAVCICLWTPYAGAPGARVYHRRPGCPVHAQRQRRRAADKARKAGA